MRFNPRFILPFLVLLGGCVRDPSLFGAWTITSLERDGIEQEDAGYMDIQRNGSAATLLRYAWTEDGFVPDAQPDLQYLAHDASPPEGFEAYRTKDETYSLELEGFEAVFDVGPYDLDHMTLKADEAMWPSDETSLPLPTRLHLVR